MARGRLKPVNDPVVLLNVLYADVPRRMGAERSESRKSLREFCVINNRPTGNCIAVYWL